MDPRIGVALPRNQIARVKEAADLCFAALRRVGSVDQVAPDLQAEIAADRAGRGIHRIGCADGITDGLDDILALNGNHNNWR